MEQKLQKHHICIGVTVLLHDIEKKLKVEACMTPLGPSFHIGTKLIHMYPLEPFLAELFKLETTQGHTTARMGGKRPRTV